MGIICKFKLVGMRTYISTVYDYGTGKSEEKKLVDLEWRVVNPNRDDPSDENKKYWSSTPTGEIKFSTVNQEAVNEVLLGREYYEEVPGSPGAPEKRISVHSTAY